MYDELVKDLRICAEGEHCDKCGKWEVKQNGGRNACEYAICAEAADAIEELSAFREHIQDVWREINKLSEEVGEGRVSVADLRCVLREEYGIEV